MFQKKQTTIAFSARPDTRRGWERKVLSSILKIHDIADAHSFFNRSSDNTTKTELSAYRIIPKTDGFHLVGIGEDASNRANELQRQLTECNSPESSILACSHENVGIEKSDKPITYTATQLIVCDDATQYMRWKNSDLQEKHQRIERVISLGILRQMQLLLQNPDEKTNILIQNISLKMEWTESKGVQSAKSWILAVSATFSSDLLLTGNWAAGALTNRGWGQLQPIQ